MVDGTQVLRETGFWKFNAALCQDRNHIHFINCCINEYIIYNPKGHRWDHIRWDALKRYQRGCTIVYSINKMKQISRYRKNLQ